MKEALKKRIQEALKDSQERKVLEETLKGEVSGDDLRRVEAFLEGQDEAAESVYERLIEAAQKRFNNLRNKERSARTPATRVRPKPSLEEYDTWRHTGRQPGVSYWERQYR